MNVRFMLEDLHNEWEFQRTRCMAWQQHLPMHRRLFLVGTCAVLVLALAFANYSQWMPPMLLMMTITVFLLGMGRWLVGNRSSNPSADSASWDRKKREQNSPAEKGKDPSACQPVVNPCSNDCSKKVIEIASNEDVIKHLLTFMDFDSTDAFVSAFHDKVVIQKGILKDAAFWENRMLECFHDLLPKELRSSAVPTTRLGSTHNSVHRDWDWSCVQKSCGFAVDFFRCGDDLHHFLRTVHVIRGDLGTITHIGNRELDGIAFPTNPYLFNPSAGAAGAVFRRAGRELDAYVNSPSCRRRHRQIGQIVVTPPFKAGVKCLLHCVGPSVTHPKAFALLSETYQNLMKTIVQEDLHCVALGSISTGMLRMPIAQSTFNGLQAILMFLRENPDWQGQIGIVCFDRPVYEAFVGWKERAIVAYNTFH